MTSISGATSSPVVWDRSKPVKLPDDFYQPEPDDSAYSKFLQAQATGVPLIPVNQPDNVWGKIGLPDGEVVTIYNGGSVQSENPLDVELPMHEGSEAERAEAILARYGGTLEITDIVNSDVPMTPGTDLATLLSSILDSPALVERMLKTPEYQLIREDLLEEKS
jgi:hypothetical protein